jgi:tetratricopeptide (TPR) repeat protein
MRDRKHYDYEDDREYRKRENVCVNKNKADRQFYNTFEFERLVKLIDTDIHGAKEGFEDYLLKYSNDLNAYTYYASLLISVGELEKAEELLNKIEARVETDSIYQRDRIKYEFIKSSVIYNRARLYAYTDRAWAAYNLIRKNNEVFKSLDYSRVFYLRSRINYHIDRNRREPNSYIFRQIVEYRESDMIDHIKKHEADYNDNNRKISTAIFAPDVPIEKLIEHAKENMRPENIINEGFAGQVYTFKYDECGRDDNKITDFFEVVVFPDTKDIITMYPTFTPNNRYYVDLNHLKEKKEDSSFGVKRLSQIEKFNKRYGTNE